MRQRHWMEYVKDFYFDLKYHPGKANVVVDTLSRNALTKAEVLLDDCKLSEKARDINLEASENDDGVWLHKLEVSCELRSRIVQA